MNGPEHNQTQQPETPTLLSRVQHRFQRPDKMDRLVQEAHDEHLLGGKVGRTMLGSYEGHRQSVWMQRSSTAMIAAIVVAVICGLINLPLPVSLGIAGVFVLVAVICIGIAVGHLFRWWGIAYGPPLSDQADMPASLKKRLSTDTSDTPDADERTKHTGA